MILQVYSGVIRKANEEKFSYLVMQKRPKNSAASFVTTVNAKKGSKRREGKSTLSLSFFQCVHVRLKSLSEAIEISHPVYFVSLYA